MNEDYRFDRWNFTRPDFLCVWAEGFLHFFPMGPMPSGLAGQYITVMMQSHYFYVAAVQVMGGALLLIGRYIPLAYASGPVIVNILIYHLLMD